MKKIFLFFLFIFLNKFSFCENKKILIFFLTHNSNLGINSLIVLNNTIYFASNNGIGYLKEPDKTEEEVKEEIKNPEQKTNEVNYFDLKNLENKNFIFITSYKNEIMAVNNESQFVTIIDDQIKSIDTIIDYINFNNFKIKKFLVTNSEIWILNHNKKLFILNKNFKENIKTFNSSLTVSDIDKDKNNNIFVSSDKGLFIYKNSKEKGNKIGNFTHILQTSLLDNKAIFHTKSMGQNEIWKIFFEDNVNYKIKLMGKLNIPDKDIYNDIKEIKLDKNGNVWIISNNITVLYPNARFYFFENSNNLINFQNTLFSEGNESNFIISSNKRNIFKFTIDEVKKIIFQGKEVTTDKKIEIKNLLFKLNDSSILPQSYEVIDELKNLMFTNKGIHLIIEGHTSRGVRPEVLLRISESRANSVKSMLVKKGISEERIQTFGFGDTKLKISDDPESDQNKRVEITIIQKEVKYIDEISQE